jgi:hypothetical protein
MTRWDELTATALIGTDRRGLQIDPQSAGGEVLGRLAQRDPASTLLASAGTVALALRAGFLPADAPAALPEVCPDDDLPACSARAAYHLALAANEQALRPALIEGLQLLASLGQRGSDALLPALLEVGRADRDLQAPVFAVLGKRGRWLARQNPDWAYALAQPGADPRRAWEHGTREERRVLLSQLRGERPDLARELLAESWPSERADDRAAYLALLEHQLGLDDEPFLEAALDDRSKQVRTTAAELLAHLPDSQLVQRMTGRLAPHLRWVSGRFWQEPRIAAEPPETLDEALIRDGIVADPPQKRIGKRAWWLQQMLAAASLDHWCTAWDRSPEQIVAAALNSDWSEALLRGFARAARRQRHAGWIMALLRGVSDEQLVDADLADGLDPAAIEALAIDRLAADRKLFGTAWHLLNRHAGPWGDPLGRAVIAALTKHLAGLSGSERNILYQHELLAQRLPIELTAAALAAWPEQLRQSRPYSEAYERFARIMLFRQAMVKEIKG